MRTNILGCKITAFVVMAAAYGDECFVQNILLSAGASS